MNSAKFVNIARLMTSYNFEIKQLPDNLKCAHCKLVLKDAYQVPCGCRFCRMCIDDMMANGVEFCRGSSEDCGEMAFSTAAPDYRANKSVSRLTVKCANDGCVHECQLVNMEVHLRKCQRKSEECPFRELGCTQDKLAAEEMGGHLQRESLRHSEILIGMVANINKEIDILKQRDEDRGREIELLRNELVQKDEQIRLIMDQLIHVENENKSMAREKADLADRVTILSEKMEHEIEERRENAELDSARVIGHVDMEIAAVREVIGSNKDELVTDIKSVRDIDIGSINRSAQSMKDDVSSMKSEMQSIKMLVGMGWIQIRYEFLIESDIGKTQSGLGEKLSDYFTGEGHAYKYQLMVYNGSDSLSIFVLIHRDGNFTYPFKKLLVITAADRDRRDVTMSMSVRCEIESIEENGFKFSDQVVFFHSELKRAGLNLRRGVRISCLMAHL